jgi:hypothetical protein
VLDVIAPHHDQTAALAIDREALGDPEAGRAAAPVRPVAHVQPGAKRLPEQPGQHENQQQDEHQRDGEGRHPGTLLPEDLLKELHNAPVP